MIVTGFLFALGVLLFLVALRCWRFILGAALVGGVLLALCAFILTR